MYPGRHLARDIYTFTVILCYLVFIFAPMDYSLVVQCRLTIKIFHSNWKQLFHRTLQLGLEFILLVMSLPSTATHSLEKQKNNCLLQIVSRVWSCCSVSRRDIKADHCRRLSRQHHVWVCFWSVSLMSRHVPLNPRSRTDWYLEASLTGTGRRWNKPWDLEDL